MIGENRYAGSFYNRDYDFSGHIYVIVHGKSQSVRLTSSNASASFRLRK
jgi:hypothetical protein